jgi:DNA-binding NarL/FixJ family response regulator
MIILGCFTLKSGLANSTDRMQPSESHPADAPQKAARRAGEGLMAVRILLVDDHPVVRQGLRTLLEGRPQLEVLDVTMPRMNGIEACRLIQQKTPGREVLFVTQHDSPQMMREALAAGARGYVVKSNLARDLVEAVEAVSQHREFTALARNPHAQS